ncbi:LuxR family transcriptional regulator [Chitinophaga silvatica]|uniref:LuxR family transcriptional regulator n=1 Tax=Chitinophaga silvatica TaxID=2282649 RepID=A0A3E1Y222_9BACT|nr:helix-turn-helix transcriptional regulator [Chitinophaga silvatica]RFS18722.1 LuxR family transcriptional regulator [Chitinophaga silvatica]
MNILQQLNDKLLLQSFEDIDLPSQLVYCQFIAQVYARLENSISVLSDLKANKSYIYTGGTAAALGISYHEKSEEIASIWEEDIFKKIREDDLLKKYTLELRFFHLLKNLPVTERSDYQVVSTLHMLDKNNQLVKVVHRMFYVQSTEDGNIWLALCLYNLSHDPGNSDAYYGVIVNTRTGTVIPPDEHEFKNLLSPREKDILSLIKRGKRSKDIAAQLSISINTVNRHRQNILEKLHVRNAMEACRIAESVKLI